MKTLKCKKCGVTVKDKTIIKHMWAAHRAHMMKNHTGGFSAKKKLAAAPAGKKIDGRTLQGRKLAAAEKQRLAPPLDVVAGLASKKHPVLGFLAGHSVGAVRARPPVHRLRAVRFAIEAGQTVEASGEIGQKKLTVVIHQDGNSIEIANVTRVDFLE